MKNLRSSAIILTFSATSSRSKVGNSSNLKFVIFIVIFITVPGIPVNVSVIPFGKYILLKWGPPVDENGVMKGYVVGVVKTTGNQLAPEKSKLETKLKSKQFEYLFEGLDHTTDYRVGIAGETGAGVGPAACLNALTVRPMGE